METLQFKTNINCGGCIAKVTPVLNKEEKIVQWDVDTNTPSKTLTVKTELPAVEVISILNRAGFNAEKV
jgi:copper chaperone